MGKLNSYWEQNQLKGIDYTIIGAGITGLSCALRLKKMDPSKRVVVLEKGVMPIGASMKNAGFACFGSVSEILSDAQHHTEQELIDLIRSRSAGLEVLKSLVPPQAMDFEVHGGFEFFTTDQEQLAASCMAKLDFVNGIAQEALSSQSVIFQEVKNRFGFGQVLGTGLVNVKEGQLNVGKMMRHLLQRCAQEDIWIIPGVEVLGYHEGPNSCIVHCKALGDLSTEKLLLATNGFTNVIAAGLVTPARAQVMITEPIPQLQVKGTFHMEEGYYYFRNIDQRLLIGGGRHLDFDGETTTSMETTDNIQSALDRMVRDIVLPGVTEVKIAARWAGVMGVGSQKRPIIKALSDRVFCGVRLGGMGVAIGSSVGAQLAELSVK